MSVKSYSDYTEKDFVEAVKHSSSIREVIRKLGLIPAGGNYNTFHRLVLLYKVDTSHFLGQAHNRGKGIYNGYKGFRGTPPVTTKDYLSNIRFIQSDTLKKRLIKEKYFEHKCYKCDRKTWNKSPIPIELEHIDGNNRNNSLDNLTILCPNCHAQTDTYKSKNRKWGRRDSNP